MLLMNELFQLVNSIFPYTVSFDKYCLYEPHNQYDVPHKLIINFST